MNYYEILEVSPNASQEVIKAAYKSLMQRYHPDRNPENAETAEHALQVGLAYEVLSDINKRAAYDIQLKHPFADRADNIRDKSRSVLSSVSNVKEEQSSWILWVLIASILLSGWLILSPSKKKQSPEAELKEIRQSFEGSQLTPKQRQAKFKRIDEIFREHPEILKREASERAKELDARTIPIFITNVTVNLRVPDNSPDSPEKSQADYGHVLSIPILGARVGTFDSEKVIRHIEGKRELISQKLAEKLAYAKYEELIKIDGELYLKKLILDSIGDTTGTNRYEDYPSSIAESPGRYGVVDALFPRSFTVR